MGAKVRDRRDLPVELVGVTRHYSTRWWVVTAMRCSSGPWRLEKHLAGNGGRDFSSSPVFFIRAGQIERTTAPAFDLCLAGQEREIFRNDFSENSK